MKSKVLDKPQAEIFRVQKEEKASKWSEKA